MIPPASTELGFETAAASSTGELQSQLSLADFAKLCTLVGAADGRTEKIPIIANYFSLLNPPDLVIAVRLLAGRYQRPPDDCAQQAIAKAVLNALVACTGVTASFAQDRLATLGKISALAFELLSGGLTIAVTGELSLQDVPPFLDQLYSLRGLRRRTDCITKILRKCSVAESCTIVKILCEDLCLGVHEGEVKQAISEWLDISIGSVQSMNLMTGDLGETAIRCSQGDVDDIEVHLFQPIPFVSATVVLHWQQLERLMPPAFIVEDKFDGARVQVHIGLDIPGGNMTVGKNCSGIRVAIFNEALLDITQVFPDLVPALAGLLMEQAGTVEAAGIILDGEIVAIANGQARTYCVLEGRLKSSEPSSDLLRSTPVGFVAFDQLYGEGRSLIRDSWSDRNSILSKTGFDRKSTFRVGTKLLKNYQDIEAELSASFIRGNAGLVIKNPSSRYRPGSYATDWLTIKHTVPAARLS
jgi:DNA ligase 1